MGARVFFGGVAVGAGVVYLLDSDRGGARRERLRGAIGHAGTARYGSRVGDIEGLEAANLDPGDRSLDLERLVRLAGRALAAYGLLRQRKFSGLLRTLGMRRPATGTRGGVRSLTPRGERRRTVDIQQTLYVEAPLERVRAFASSYDNFPRFMAHVREVKDLGGGRSLWVVGRPDGEQAAWHAVVTAREDPWLLAWRSEPGAVLDNTGAIRLREEGAGTRIDLRFCYSPPGTRAGRALAGLFGADPRARMHEDLEQLRTLLESTIGSDSHG